MTRQQAMEIVAIHCGLIPDLPLPDKVEPWPTNRSYWAAVWGKTTIVIGPDLPDRERHIAGDEPCVLTHCASLVLDAGIQAGDIASAAWKIGPWLRAAAGR